MWYQRLGVVVVSIVMTWAAASAQPAQAPQSGGTLEIKQSEIPGQTGHPPVVRPAPQPEAAISDAERAIEEREAAERREKILREITDPASRRPDLDYDVKSGIQQKAIEKSLRERPELRPAPTEAR